MLGVKSEGFAFDVRIADVEVVDLIHERLQAKKKPPKVFVQFILGDVKRACFEGQFSENGCFKLSPLNDFCSFFWYTNTTGLMNSQVRVSIHAPSSGILSAIDTIFRIGDKPMPVSEITASTFDVGEIKPPLSVYTIVTKTVKHDLGLFNGVKSCGRIKFNFVMTQQCEKTTCTLAQVQLRNWNPMITHHDVDATEEDMKRELKLAYFYTDISFKGKILDTSHAHITKPTSASCPAPGWMRFDLLQFHYEFPKMETAEIQIRLMFCQRETMAELGRANIPLMKYYRGTEQAVTFREEVIPVNVGETQLGTYKEKNTRSWELVGSVCFNHGPKFAQMWQGVLKETGVEDGAFVGVPQNFKNPDVVNCDQPHVHPKVDVRKQLRIREWKEKINALKEELHASKGICNKYSTHITSLTARSVDKIREKGIKKKQIQELRSKILEADQRIVELKNGLRDPDPPSSPVPHEIGAPPGDIPDDNQPPPTVTVAGEHQSFVLLPEMVKEKSVEQQEVTDEEIDPPQAPAHPHVIEASSTPGAHAPASHEKKSFDDEPQNVKSANAGKEAICERKHNRATTQEHATDKEPQSPSSQSSVPVWGFGPDPKELAEVLEFINNEDTARQLLRDHGTADNVFKYFEKILQ